MLNYLDAESSKKGAPNENLGRELMELFVLGEGNSNEGWIVKIYYNPLVIWIWIGAIFVFLGGIISINNNLRTEKNLYK